MPSLLSVGDPAPWFILPSARGSNTHLDTIVGGYRVVLFFFGSSNTAQVGPVLHEFYGVRSHIEALGVAFLGVSIDPHDPYLEPPNPSQRFQVLPDLEGELSLRYGVCQLSESGGIDYDPTAFVLDENLRIRHILPLDSRGGYVERIMQLLQAWPQSVPRLITQQAPVLIIPQVFSPELCQQLIRLYEADGGTESGFMQQDGDPSRAGEAAQTVIKLNPQVKRRRDFLVNQPLWVQRITELVGRRVKPEIEKVFHYRMTSAERYTVGCYEASSQGFFQPHRDNTAAGTAHRRWAMTLNLNTGEYDGGCLRFPEYGADLYAPEAGSAVIFSCSLLHEVTPVTQGRRFALLSFFYGDEEAKLRQQTQAQIVRPDAAPSPHPPRGFQPKREKRP